MDTDILYKDSLVTVTTDFIVLKNYYFPLIGPKRIPFAKIQSVAAQKASLLTGQWRIWGTRNFTTWFALDFARPSRDTIFIISLVGKRIRVGFTVENSEAMLRILQQKGLIH